VPRKVFVAGEILTAADVNTNLMDQAVMVFDDSTARGSAIPSPTEGMVTYLKDTNQVQAYNGSAFAPLGTILQVVSTAKTDTFSTASTSFVDVTGLSATITPISTSSKILILVQIGSSSDNNTPAAFRLSGGNSTNYVGDAAGSRTRSAYGIFGDITNISLISVMPGQITYLDSPSTTSATTYQLQAKAETGTLYVNRASNDSDLSSRFRGASSITLIEVAG
jgi:hypothetical protein